jgi:hypothetical protein
MWRDFRSVAQDMNHDAIAKSAKARVLGSLSVASGALLLCAPRTMAELYALPRDTKLCRMLGVRDVTIGLLLRRERWATLGFVLRACADGFDASLIADELKRKPPSAREGRLQLTGALGLVCLSVTSAFERVRHAHAE